MLVTPKQPPGVLMSVIHAALMGSYRTSNAGVIVSNCAAHVSWTEHVACQWNGQAHVLSVMKARVAQRRHGRVPPVGLCRAQYATWKHRGSA
jgi:NAD dependent epimerase/dehydratase family enzyme